MSMKIIKSDNIEISKVIAGYINDSITDSVTAMNGRLNIRPEYQRGFIWDKGDITGPKQKALIDSILNNYPINVMYWVKTGVNDAGEDMYEVLDGQQRLITICKFAQNDFSVQINGNNYTYDNMTDKNKLLGYDKMTVYICEGTLEEKLDWFKRINTAGEPLTAQEMRSAIACGKGTTKAKKYFISDSKSGTVAYSFDSQNGHPARDYVSGERDRQAIYERVITWFINSKKDEDIIEYMINHRNDENTADNLYEYFKNVITWVKRLFPTYNKEMSKVEWGFLYNRYSGNTSMSATILEKQVLALMADDEVQKKYNIYEYVLKKSTGTDDSKLLNLRAFKNNEMVSAYNRQRGVCPSCKKRWESEQMAGDHILPWSKGGKTVPDNLQMLCEKCNGDKSNKPYDIDEEKKGLQKVIEMTQEEVDTLPEGKID